jgi:hypothetical protein
VAPKRGDRVAPPAGGGEWELRFPRILPQSNGINRAIRIMVENQRLSQAEVHSLGPIHNVSLSQGHQHIPAY